MCVVRWKHVINNVETHIWLCGYACVVIRMYVFGYARIRARWIGPLRLAECTWCISWANVDISQNVCNLFFICMLHNCHTKVWLLPCKSMVFAVQKGGFYNAKSGFLKEHIGILGVWNVLTSYVIDCYVQPLTVFLFVEMVGTNGYGEPKMTVNYTKR